MVNNPLYDIAEAVLESELGRIRVYGIMINPVTYYLYLNNPFVAGLHQHGDEFCGFPGIKRIFKNDMPLNKIILIKDTDMIDFMVKT